MANSLIGKSIKAIKNPNFLTALSAYPIRKLSSLATVEQPQSEGPSSSFAFSSNGGNEKKEDSIYIKGPNSNRKRDASSSSVTMPMSFMTGSIVGKRFYKQVTTREADDGNGWTVVLDYRTLKTPSKRSLKLPTLALAKAIVTGPRSVYLVTRPRPVYLVDFSCYLPHPHLQAKFSDFMEHSRLTGDDLRNLSLHLQYNLICVQIWWCL